MTSPPTFAALLTVVGFLVLAGFQAALAAGVPWGGAAWGGKHTRLPLNLRRASLVSMIVWLVAALIVLDRAAIPLVDLPDAASYWGTWILVVLLALGAVMNVASSSPYERFGWAPFALILALLTLVVALS